MSIIKESYGERTSDAIELATACLGRYNFVISGTSKVSYVKEKI